MIKQFISVSMSHPIWGFIIIIIILTQPRVTYMACCSFSAPHAPKVPTSRGAPRGASLQVFRPSTFWDCFKCVSHFPFLWCWTNLGKLPLSLTWRLKSLLHKIIVYPSKGKASQMLSEVPTSSNPLSVKSSSGRDVPFGIVDSPDLSLVPAFLVHPFKKHLSREYCLVDVVLTHVTLE